jgi:anti-sigma factor RsiW
MNMNCQICTENLTAYLDGELSRLESDELENHLEICSPCAEERNSLEEAFLFIDNSLPQPLKPSPKIWGHVHSRIAQPAVRSALPGFLQIFQTSRWAPAAAAVAAALVIGLGLWGYFLHRETDQDLNQYMVRYIEARDLEEQMHKADDPPVLYPTHSELQANPFVVETVDTSFSNPFRVK